MRHSFISVSASGFLLCLALMGSAFSPLALTSASEPPRQNLAVTVDPNKAPSELNHRIAGVFLLAIGLCILGGERYQSLAWLRRLPSILFIAAGLFLVAWSDAEMWPRGNRGWSWLIYHDAEALQHKFYGLLLVAIGLVEGIQASAKYRRRWLNIAFPVLCVIGGSSLFFHHHSGHIEAAPTPANGQFIPVQAAAHEHTHHPDTNGAAPSFSASASMESNISGNAHISGNAQGQSHQHGLMTGPEAKIQREHAWFALVGFCIALFKFLYDSAKPPARVRRYLWVNSLLLLGLLLLFYTE